MKVSIEPLSPVQTKISIEIPADRVHAGLERAYQRYQSQVQLKGFRAGRVPRRVMERRFGERITSEVGSALVEESLPEAIREHGLAIVTQPQVVTERLVVGSPFCYSATVETKPEVQHVAYEGLAVDKKIAPVTEQAVDDTLARLADSLAQLHPIADRDHVEAGDVVRLDYRAERDGRLIAGLEGAGRLFEMGRETLLPGFQEKIIGARKGHRLSFSLPLPQGPQAGTDAPPDAQSADFQVTIHDIARKEVPRLDDEFAKDHGECDTLEALRAKLRENLEQSAERRAEQQMESDLVSQMLRRHPVEVPPGLVREHAQRLFVETGLQPRDGMAFDDPALPQAVREDLSARAKRQIETTWLLDALAEQLGLTLSEDAVNTKVAEFAAANAEQRQQVEALYADADNRRMLQSRLLREEALRAVVEKADIRTVHADVAETPEND